MPGHIKKTSGPDPDPSPWLVVSDALKAKNKAKPYDTKKSVWVGMMSSRPLPGYDCSISRFQIKRTVATWRV